MFSLRAISYSRSRVSRRQPGLDAGGSTSPRRTRYKTAKEHIVPLSAAARDVLALCPRLEGNPFVFVSPMKPRAALSHMACLALFKRLGINATLHGTARSTFSDWAHDFTEVPHEIIECLGHNVGNAVHRAYRRGAAIEKRRALLEMWAGCLLATQLSAPALSAMAAE
jgi:integrase